MYIKWTTWADHRGKRLRIALGVALALPCFVPTVAEAQLPEVAAPSEAAPTDPPPASTARSWYGYQTLAIDGGAIAFATFGTYVTLQAAQNDGSMSAAASGVGIVGLATLSYVVGPPIVHWAHGRVTAGFESLGLRLLAPLAGLGIGAIVAQIANGSSDQTALPVGAAFGLLAASALDATLIGWEIVPDRAPLTSRLQPRVVLNSRMAFVGLGGAF